MHTVHAETWRMKRIGILLLAAGAGKRFGGNKLEALVDGKPMFLHALELIEKQNVLQNIVFRNCEFTQIPFEAVDDGKNHGSLFHHDKKLHPLEIRYANVKFENTSFNIIGE